MSGFMIGPNSGMKPELSEVFTKAELCAALGLVALDEAFCNYDEADGHIQLLLLCSDTFAYACADAEEIPMSAAPALLQQIQDGDKWAVTRYVAAKRGETVLPQIKSMMEKFDRERLEAGKDERHE